MQKGLHNRDIIIIGQQPWDTEIGSNCKDIAIELSKNNRVLYVNSPLDRITRFRGKADPKIQKRISVIKGETEGLIEVKENLWNYYPDCILESINWINNHFAFNFLNKINNRRSAISITKALKKLKFSDVILFNDNEMFKGFFLKDFLQPAISIYYSRDYMLGVDYWKKHGSGLEPKLIAKSDICFANSQYLADYCSKYNPNSYNVGQGCDFSNFTDIESVELSNLPKKDNGEKNIGYVGSLNSERLDIDVLILIAKSFSNHNILLIGPEDENFKNSELHQLSNVYFLGAQPVDTLPQYILAIDVCINPQMINEITVGNYPRKIDEYLALGKPTVATSTKTMQLFKDFVYLANDAADYVKLINIALAEDSDALRQDRIQFAMLHTWQNSVKEMSLHVENYEKLKSN